MKRVCFYHAGCPDGFGAVWSVWRSWGKDGRYIGRGHNDPLPYDELEDALVAFVDIAVDNESLRRLADVAAHVIILDHHVSAQLRYDSDLPTVNHMEDAGHEILFDLSHSGAVLSWNYFHPDEPPPPLLEYVEDQDLWNWKLEGSEQVNAAIASYPREFEVWDALAQRSTDELVREGEPIVRANRMEVQRAIKNPETIFIGSERIEAVNASVNRSAIGHELAIRGAFGTAWGCVYRIGGGKVHATLYSIGDVDVSKVAGSLGGGGHRNAAGFTVSLAEWVDKFQ
ncbi:MAG: oligoribonuclease NrnB/cAMP/cGMP phosphodiesterase (DHH superfamily) [Myxococcota bacterium]|jgi:oligoribonuclease NrnB/cAMP/cGMP phosphodiesterase (DHH superfamily)